MIQMARKAWAGHLGDHCDSVFGTVVSQGMAGPRKTQSVAVSLCPALVITVSRSSGTVAIYVNTYIYIHKC